jgi:peptidoglycan-associated lipoprotein
MTVAFFEGHGHSIRQPVVDVILFFYPFNECSRRETMLVKSMFSTVILTIMFGFAACTDDKKATEPVAPTAEGSQPDAPSGADASGLNGAPVYFAFDDYTLSSESQGVLTTVAEGLKANKAAVIQIEGHCDERGTIEYNLALGERRAQSVKNFLTQLGVESSRLSTISFGEEKPVLQGHSEDAWGKNRRAELVITKN